MHTCAPSNVSLSSSVWIAPNKILVLNIMQEINTVLERIKCMKSQMFSLDFFAKKEQIMWWWWVHGEESMVDKEV
jgi:hypothetical protein